MLRFGISALFLLTISMVPAHSQDKPKALKLSAVAGQEIQMQYGLSLDRDCQPFMPIKIGVPKPPKNGTVTERDIEAFSNFDRENARYACNSKKSKAVAAYYKPKDGFKGIDRFTFVIVYYDGTYSTYNTEVVVW